MLSLINCLWGDIVMQILLLLGIKLVNQDSHIERIGQTVNKYVEEVGF